MSHISLTSKEEEKVCHDVDECNLLVVYRPKGSLRALKIHVISKSGILCIEICDLAESCIKSVKLHVGKELPTACAFE